MPPFGSIFLYGCADMIEPYTATTVIIAFLIIYAFIIPVIASIPKIGKMISYRYQIVTVFLACTIGVIINFNTLENSIRMAVIIGTTVLVALYILLRGYEKIAKEKDLEASVSKGDAKAEIKLTKKEGDSHD
jgi:hypothetical protein